MGTKIPCTHQASFMNMKSQLIAPSLAVEKIKNPLSSYIRIFGCWNTPYSMVNHQRTRGLNKLKSAAALRQSDATSSLGFSRRSECHGEILLSYGDEWEKWGCHTVIIC